jgi:hypothetical protein
MLTTSVKQFITSKPFWQWPLANYLAEIKLLAYGKERAANITIKDKGN